MTEHVDLTEDGVFQDRGIHYYSSNQADDEKSQPVICWLGNAWKSPEYLRQRSEELHRYERLLSPDDKKEQKLDWTSYRFNGDYDGDTIYYKTNDNTISSSTIRVNSSTSAVVTTTSWDINDTNVYLIPRNTYRYSINAYARNSTTLNNYSDTVKYVLQYVTDSAPKEISREERLEGIRLDLWGTTQLPITEKDVFKISSKFLYDPLPWKREQIHRKDELDEEELPQFFPWFPKPYTPYGEEESALKVYRKEIHIFNESIRTTKGNPSEIFARIGENDPWNDWTSWIKEGEDGSLEYSYEEKILPWMYDTEANHSSTDGSAILLPSKMLPVKETSSSFTESIRACLPWMIDMIRDVWKETISPNLIEEYFKDQWHFITIPDLREKWYEGNQDEDVIEISNDGTFTINSNAINASNIRANGIQVDLNNFFPTYATYSSTTTNTVRPISITDWTVL